MGFPKSLLLTSGVLIGLTGFVFVPVSAGERRRLDLSILGTEVEFDKARLPARLEGVVFFRGGPNDGSVAGTYEETLRPLVDPELGLVGTIGESVFLLVRRKGATVSSERIVTRNRSRIVGEILSDGALWVESTGRVVAGPVGGTLRSSGTARLGPRFQLDVEVSLVFGEPESDSLATRRKDQDASADTTLVVTVGGDGETRLRYSQEFKRSVLRRLTGEGAVTPAVLSAETGLSEVILSRWGQQARVLAAIGRVQKALRPAPRQWTFEEKLGVVLKTATYSEEELTEFLSLEGIAKEELAAWRHAIETAVEAGIRSRTTGDRGEGETGDTEDEVRREGEDLSLDARALEEVKKRVEALLGNESAEETEATPEGGNEE